MREPTTLIASVAVAGVLGLGLRAEAVWTSSACAPAAWAACSGNLLAGLTGTFHGTVADNNYSTNDPTLLTDSDVPETGGKSWIVGFQNTVGVSWTFPTPRTIESVRISCCYLADATYSGFTVSSVEVQAFGATAWTALNAAAGQKTSTGNNDVLSLTLAEENGGALATGVGALKVTFGAPPIGYQNYCAEIEATGFAEATGPVLDAFEIAPAKTKANLSGTIVDPGTDASACALYLSLNGADAVKIAEGVSGAFVYQIKGLTAGTSYAYELSVSNNAPTAKGISQSGTFETLAADASTAVWTQGEYANGAWASLDENILARLDASEKTKTSSYASQNMTWLTDGNVPELDGSMTDAQAGAETVGFQPDGTIAWTFDTPQTIKTLRLTSLWKNTSYNGISVNAVYVKYSPATEWEALNVPAVSWKGGTQLAQTETLSDIETGVLAKGAIGLKIVFGTQKAAVANYYAEIEAVGRETPKQGMVVVIR